MDLRQIGIQEAEEIEVQDGHTLRGHLRRILFRQRGHRCSVGVQSRDVVVIGMGNDQAPVVDHIGVIPRGSADFRLKNMTRLGGNEMVRECSEVAVIQGEGQNPGKALLIEDGGRKADITFETFAFLKIWPIDIPAVDMRDKNLTAFQRLGANEIIFRFVNRV